MYLESNQMIIGLTLAQREKSCIYLGRGHKHQKSMINTSQQNFAERPDIQLKKSAGNSAKAAPKNHPLNWLRGKFVAPAPLPQFSCALIWGKPMSAENTFQHGSKIA
jgi:hypothetical protein